MSDDQSRNAKVAEFCEYTKNLKVYWDKVWAMEAERRRLLDEADRKYDEQFAKEQRAALEKQLRESGSSQTGARAGQVLK